MLNPSLINVHLKKNTDMINKCCLCGGNLVQREKIIHSHYKSIPYCYTQSGEYCDECGESFLSPEDLNSSKEERRCKKEGIDRYLVENYKGIHVDLLA